MSSSWSSLLIGLGSFILSMLLCPMIWAQSDSLLVVDSTPTSSVNVDQLLAGTVPGLAAISSSGQPGAPVSVSLRGPQSFHASTQPLYVVDGFPLISDNTLLNSGFVAGPLLNGLGFLASQDVASVQVLRGAEATSLYGSRASGGVILIRTRQGDEGKLSIQLSSSLGAQTPINRYDLADGGQYGAFLNAAADQAGQSPPFANPGSLSTNTDWQDLIYRQNPLIQQHNLTFSGGDDRFRFLLSGSYDDVKGLVQGSDLGRVSIRANLEANLTPKVTLSNALAFSRYQNSTVSTDEDGVDGNFGVIAGAYLFSPLLPAANQDGDLIPFNYAVAADGSVTSFLHRGIPVANPLGLATSLQSEATTSRIFDIAALHYSFSDRFHLDASLGFDVVLNEEATFWPGALDQGDALGGRGASAKMQFYRWMQQLTLTHETDLAQDHLLKLTGGVSNEGYHRDFLGGISSGFENEALGFYSLEVGRDKAVNSELTKWGLQSIISSAHYQFKDKVEIQLGLRADASSIFDNELYLFPSLAGAFQLISPVETDQKLTGLSLRLGYSHVGNQRIPAYSRFTFLDEFSSSLNGADLNGISLSRPADGKLKMERTHQLNAGMTASLFDRLAFDLDLYHHRTIDALISTALPGTAGYSQVLTNGGEISNQGVELGVTLLPGHGHVRWQSGLYLGFSSNEVIELPNQTTEQILGPQVAAISDWSILRIGESIGTFYGLLSDGFVGTGEQVRGPSGDLLKAGDQKYLDLNGDGVINGLDRTILGKSLPDVTVGFSNQLNWKNFDLRIHLQGLIGREVANLNALYLLNPSGIGNVLSDLAAGSGSLPGPNADRREQVFSDLIVEEASFLRLQQVRLGFTLPSKIVDQIPLSYAHFFIQGENLLTLTGYSGIDPEVSHFGLTPLLQGVDFGGYPRAKIFRAGLTIKF